MSDFHKKNCFLKHNKVETNATDARNWLLTNAFIERKKKHERTTYIDSRRICFITNTIC